MSPVTYRGYDILLYPAMMGWTVYATHPRQPEPVCAAAGFRSRTGALRYAKQALRSLPVVPVVERFPLHPEVTP